MVSKATIVTGLFVLYLAVLTSTTSGSSIGGSRSKRSVNFTPSWGKRSSGFASETPGGSGVRGAAAPAGLDEKCMAKELYIEMLIDNLKVRNFTNKGGIAKNAMNMSHVKSESFITCLLNSICHNKAIWRDSK